MIYFDNAASGRIKPPSVIGAATYAMTELSVNAGRSGHALSETAERLIFSARRTTCNVFNGSDVSRVIFTHNCTAALNLAIFGINAYKRTIVTTVTEHNSVLRPLYKLQKSGYKLIIADFYDKPYITAESVLKLVDGDTAFVVMNAASNVTGYINEYEKVGKALKPLGIPLIVDGAQAGGHIRIDMLNSGISCLALAGHKGLLSIQGAGALLFDKSVEISPLLYGGSGSETFNEVPSCYPEKLEAGTHDLAAILSFGEGVKISDETLDERAEKLLSLTGLMINGLKTINGVRIYSQKNVCGICSFSVKDLSSIDLARTFSERFSIAVRGGFHCAPLIHKSLKTCDNGLIRASLSEYNTEKEVATFLNATKTLADEN